MFSSCFSRKSLKLVPVMATTLAILSGAAHASTWDQGNDPKNFVTDWHSVNYNYQFNMLPLDGALPPEKAPWGDSYWPKQRGAMTYRWQQFSTVEQNQELTLADRQRLFFNYKLYSKSELQRMSAEEINKLSPLEKYSIYIGDYSYSLVKDYQKKNSPSDISWEGYCHAWSAASLHYSEPNVVTRTNVDGIKVSFGSADVKALLTANYAEKFGFKLFGEKSQRRQIGFQCKNRFQYPESKILHGVEVMSDYGDFEGLADSEIESKIRTYQTTAVRVYSREHGMDWIKKAMPEILNPQLPQLGRQGAEDPSCLDTNAGAFHVVMANQLGLMKEGFQFDKTRDVEIWNQPAYKYDSKIIGEERPGAGAAPGTVAVKLVETVLSYADDTDYGWAFYFPALSSLFKGPDANFMAEYDRYNQVLLNHGDVETAPQYPEGIIGSSTYKYKLELNSSGRIIGGSWISMDRPDFLWIMKKEGFDGKFKRLGEIYEPVRY